MATTNDGERLVSGGGDGQVSPGSSVLLCVCACVRVCVCACVRVRVRVREEPPHWLTPTTLTFCPLF